MLLHSQAQAISRDEGGGPPMSRPIAGETLLLHAREE